MSFLNNITSMFSSDKAFLGTESMHSQMKLWKVVGTGTIAVAAVLGSIASYGVVAQSVPATSATVLTPGLTALSRSGVSPAAAIAVLGSSTTSSNNITLPAPLEIKQAARGLNNNPDSILRMVRNSIKNHDAFGATKGALGALVDGSGTAFDQAMLVAQLLKESGYSPTYSIGTATVNGAEFQRWFGESDAKIACMNLAAGGIPATINGVSDCAALTGQVQTATFLHAWVNVTVDGQVRIMDPFAKAHKTWAGENIASLSGLASENLVNIASSGSATGTESGLTWVSGFSSSALSTRLNLAATTLYNAFNSDGREQKGIKELAGGREIIPDAVINNVTYTPSTGLGALAAIPNQFRTRLGIAINLVSSNPGGVITNNRPVMSKVVFADEAGGRQISVRTGDFVDNTSANTVCTQSDGYTQFRFDPQLIIGDTIVASVTDMNVSPFRRQGNIQISVNHPYAASNGVSGDETKSFVGDLVTDLLIVAAFGEAGPRQASMAREKYQVEREMPFAWGNGTGGTEPPAIGFRSERNRYIGAAQLADRLGAVISFVSGPAKAKLIHSHTIGVVGSRSQVSIADTPREGAVPGVPIDPHCGAYVKDEAFFSSVSSSVGVSNTSGGASLGAIHKTLSALQAQVEGLLTRELTDSVDVSTTAERFAWASDQGFKFYQITSAQGKSLGLTGLTNLTTFQGGKVPTTEFPAGGNVVADMRQQFAQQLLARANANATVIAPLEVFLGPGNTQGQPLNSGTCINGCNPNIYNRPSLSRGAALVSYGSNGTEAAHVSMMGEVPIKGGSATAAPSKSTANKALKVPGLSELVKDNFTLAGPLSVDLASGKVSYQHPGLMKVGSGDFPYSLSYEPFLESPTHVYARPDLRWGSNFDIGADIRTSLAAGLGTSNPSHAVPLLVTITALLRTNESSGAIAADAIKREVTAALTLKWLTNALIDNVVAIKNGQSTTDFVRRVDGSFDAPRGTNAGLVQSARRQGLVPPRAGWPERQPRQWSGSGVEFTHRLADNSVQRLTVHTGYYKEDQDGAGAQEKPVYGELAQLPRYVWKISNWTFKNGVSLAFQYQTSIGTGPYSDVVPNLVQVSSNYGQQINISGAFTTPFEIAQSQSITGVQNGVVVASATIAFPNNLNAQVTDTLTAPDGSQTRITFQGYVPSARVQPIELYRPKDTTSPTWRLTYDALGQATQMEVAAVDTGTRNYRTVQFKSAWYAGRRIDPLGGTNAVQLTAEGQPYWMTNEVGVAARYEYDGLGRVVTAFFEENAGASFKAGCMAAKGSRSNCWRTEYEYDARGNVTKEIKYPYAWEGHYWFGTVEITEAAYSADFNMPIWVRGPYATDATEADKDAKKTSLEYDSRGLLVKITQPVEYDRPAGATKAGVQEFEYDQYGRLVREKDASGRWTDTGYGENGQPIWCQTSKTRSTQPGGLNLRSTATCTAAGDVATATDAKGNVTTFTYDAMRRKATETAPLGVQKRWIYDLDGNVEKEGAWDGAAWKDLVSTYSPTGKVLTQTDPAGDQVKFTYDALDRVSIKTDPEGRQVLTCYNAASQVLEEWRGKGLTAGQCGQAVSQASASTPQRYIKNQYGGPAGAITASWDPNNNATTYVYQGFGIKAATYWPDGKDEQSYYNKARPDGIVEVLRDREGRERHIYTDKLGRQAYSYSQERPSDFTDSKIQINYFDSAGNLNWAGSWHYPSWRIQSSKEYDRDAAGRVYFERTYYSFPMDAAGNVTCWACDSSQIMYGYDANDNRTSMHWYQSDLTTIAKRADYGYDALNRMKDISFGDWGGANQGSVNYQYDTLGRRTKVTRGNGTSTDYAYENDSDLDWMRHLFQGGASATAANGNWVGIDYAYDKSGRVTLTSATDSRIMGALPTVGTYGAANNLNQVANVPGRAAMTWSDAGNLKTDGKGTTFTHDGRNRLKRAVKSDGTTLDFLYTVEGYRVESIRNATGTTPAGLPSGGTRTRFLLSGSEEVADLDANRNFIRYFVPGPAIDERVAQIEANGAVTYMHTDRQASVVAITDAAGNVVSRRGYGSYGETDGAQLVGAGSHPFGYTGRRWDPDLGIYYYRARWYDPETATFLQTDPIGSLDYINLYAYVGLEPGNKTDPTGECATACSVVVGAAIGAAIEIAAQVIEKGKIVNPGAVGREALLGGAAGLTGAGAGRLAERAVSVGARAFVGARAAAAAGKVAGGAAGGAVGSATATAGRNLVTTHKINAQEVANSAKSGALAGAVGTAVGRKAGAMVDAAKGRRPGGPEFRNPSRQPVGVYGGAGEKAAGAINDAKERASCSTSSRNRGAC
jgi:RHS repeat-associated protein